MSVDHHWECDFEIDTTKCGFTYVIINNYKEHKRYNWKYFGYKTFHSKSGGKWNYYKSSATANNKMLHRDIEECGKENFSFKIIALYNTKEELVKAEEKLILNAGWPNIENIYNRCCNRKFNSIGRIYSKEEKETFSILQKKRYEDPEERKKVSISLSKRYEDPEERKKTSLAMINFYKDPQQRERARQAVLKRYEDPEERIKQGLSIKKMWENPERKEKHILNMIERYKDQTQINVKRQVYVH